MTGNRREAAHLKVFLGEISKYKCAVLSLCFVSYVLPYPAKDTPSISISPFCVLMSNFYA